MNICKRFIIHILLFMPFLAFSQIPAGYYDGAEGLSGRPLREALKNIIDNHQEQSYSSLWNHFRTTDDKTNGKVWDMYSDLPGGNPPYEYNFGSDQCGNYSGEGDCYNREHSFPKSWFNDESPMNTDLFHIYPTDGYVNGMRSNYPFGEVNNPSWTSANGSKVGNCSFTGYSGVVFEPVHEYKGDFARTYFYMLTRYMNDVDAWSSEMLAGDDFSLWAKELLLEWDNGDPVSQKEIDRNNAVYLVQDNRNPFIDHPEYSGLIWGLNSGIESLPDMNIKIWYSANCIHIKVVESVDGIMTLYTVMGQKMDEKSIRSGHLDWNLQLNPGIYIVLFSSQNRLMSCKLIVSK
jgi:endonuclease I